MVGSSNTSSSRSSTSKSSSSRDSKKHGSSKDRGNAGSIYTQQICADYCDRDLVKAKLDEFLGKNNFKLKDELKIISLTCQKHYVPVYDTIGY